MSPTLTRSSVLHFFEHGNTLEISNRMMELPQEGARFDTGSFSLSCFSSWHQTCFSWQKGHCYQCETSWNHYTLYTHQFVLIGMDNVCTHAHTTRACGNWSHVQFLITYAIKNRDKSYYHVNKGSSPSFYSFYQALGICLFMTCPSINTIPYSGKLSWWKTFANCCKIRFSRRKLSRIACWCRQRPKFAKKTFANSDKPQNS